MDSTGNGAQSEVARGRGDFHYGDRIQLSDSKGKLYSFTLVEGGSWHSHKGIIEHAQCIGLPEGSFVLTSSGTPYFALRPLYEDFVLAMPRGATIVYPKDAADIVGYADIAEGDVVLEAGVGSGALTIALLRAVGPTGVVISTERRDDFATIAEKKLELFFGKRPENWQVRIGSFQEAQIEWCSTCLLHGSASKLLRAHSGPAASSSPMSPLRHNFRELLKPCG
jgi:tRNA (adenine57-N1/adenine58-N1)-methyltransferase